MRNGPASAHSDCTACEFETVLAPLPKRSPKKKNHTPPLLIVKQRLDEGLQPMELAKDDRYFDIVMKNIAFLEKYALQREQQTPEHVVVTVSDGGDTEV
jgi:hypothetical protein